MILVITLIAMIKIMVTKMIKNDNDNNEEEDYSTEVEAALVVII